MKDDEQILAKQKIKGISGSLRDNSLALLENRGNARILFGYPITHLAHLYELGDHGIVFGPNLERKKLRLDDRVEIFNHRINRANSSERKQKLKNHIDRIVERKEAKFRKKENARRVALVPGYSKEKALAKKEKVIARYDRKIAEAKTEKRKNKLRARKARKVDKKDRKVKFGNQFMRWGEPLSVYDHNKSRLAASEITKYLNSKGYFNAEVKIDTSTYDSLGVVGKAGRNLRNWISRWSGAKHRYINLEYNVKRNQRYFIDSIQYEIQDPILAELIMENEKDAPLKKSFYDQTILTSERDFLYDLAVNNGYYDFSKQYISFQVDSTQLGKDTLIVREIIRNPPDQEEHKIYYLDSIVFISDASVSQTYNRTMEQYRDISFSFGKNRYSKKILAWRIPLQQDDRYSRDLTFETQRQLSFLDNFKFINIKYDTLNNLFIANIFTSTFDKYQTSSEFGFSSTQGNPGPFFNVNLKNRNTFRALEIITMDFNAKLQDLRNVSGTSDNFDGNYTSRQFGGELAVSFPQFLFPLGSYYKQKIGRYNPQTRLSFGVSFEDRIDEYRRLTYRGTFAYSWQVRDQVRYTLTPLQVSWIDSKNDPDFQTNFLDSLERAGNSYFNAFESAVVTSTSFEREQNIGDYGLGQEGGFIRVFLESGGNFNSIISNSIFGDRLETFNYAKANLDLRRIERLSRKYNLAFRLNIGYAYPFGNNQALPYDKYFFAGGSNSIRGWKPRRLGPGGFATFELDDNDNPTEFVDYSREQPGEILIESSIELRRDLVGFVEGAIFLDAGNVWLIRDNSEDGSFEEGVFRFDRFMNQMAVAVGTGLRFDLQFLIFRVDLGVKFIDPAQPAGRRFLGGKIFEDFGRNSEINIGIGYPF